MNGIRVLIIDDEAFSRAQTGRQLAGALVFEAVDVSDALRQLVGRYFDVVICDLHMPGDNGFALLRAIRSGSASCRRDIPVIMLTVDRSMEAIDQAAALDIDQFLVKPVPAELIRNIVLKLAGLGRTRVKPPAAYV